MKKILVFLVSLIPLYVSAQKQKLNSSQTIDYINRKLESAAFVYVSQPKDNIAKDTYLSSDVEAIDTVDYFAALDMGTFEKQTDIKLDIRLSFYYGDNKWYNETKSIYFTDIDTNGIKLSYHNTVACITIRCKNGDCILRKASFHEDTLDFGYGNQYLDSLNIYFSRDEEVGQNVLNALKYLCRVTLKDPLYRKKNDPNDPFSTKN